MKMMNLSHEDPSISQVDTNNNTPGSLSSMNQHLKSSTTPASSHATTAVGGAGGAGGSTDDGSGLHSHYQQHNPIGASSVHQQHPGTAAPTAYGYDASGHLNGATHLQPLQQQPIQHLPMHSLPQQTHHYPIHSLGQQGHSQSHTPQISYQQQQAAAAAAAAQGQAPYGGQNPLHQQMHHQLMTPNPYQQHYQQQQLPHLHATAGSGAGGAGSGAHDSHDHLNLQFNPMAYQQQSQQQQLHHLGHQIPNVTQQQQAQTQQPTPLPPQLHHLAHNPLSQSLPISHHQTPQPTPQPQGTNARQPRQTKKQKQQQQQAAAAAAAHLHSHSGSIDPNAHDHGALDAHTLAQQHHMEMLARASQNEMMESSTRKVAPRSSDLFRVGPPFGMMKQHAPVYCKANDMQVFPMLHARVDRGFEMGETGTWIGYKRNYFTLVASFNLQDFDFTRFVQNQFYTYDKSKGLNGNGLHHHPHHPHAAQPHHHPHHPHHAHHAGETRLDISYFAIRLVAKCSDDDVAISLIQHTAKRDKGPQFPPPIYPALPGDLPDHETVKASCNKRNGNKIENMNKVFFFDRASYYGDYGLDSNKDRSILRNYPSDSISKVARFERIQFTSSIRVKSTSTAARYFTLSCELLGIVEDEDSQIQPILLGSIESPPLVIRGRSPSSYHKDRTSGYRPPNTASPAGP
ncbi:hypothetical protein CANMA_004684 [Candida margitis]|uniref:uncharacterized protein n=1 Tax=Candida margitis TaxID=1775924 RepID=UPI002226D83B|nr:uncharacterized protein CANMA_004684 [Candida margitis]KAI5953846.1 hypothetical protein CANMA_004684 [Candida margitis]